MKTVKSLILGSVAAAAFATAAWAAVTFDPATGFGTVGKGDVQTALGMNDAQLQAAAGGLAFAYSDNVVTTVICQRENQNNVVTQNRVRTRSVVAVPEYETRKNSQGKVTQFNLLGYSSLSETSSGPNPECPAADGWVETSRSELSTGGGLTVNGVSLGFF